MDRNTDGHRKYLYQLMMRYPTDLLVFNVCYYFHLCSSHPDIPCPTANDWVLEGDYCYYFSAGINLRLGWIDANAWCMDNGGYLVSIHGSEEQDKLVYYVSVEYHALLTAPKKKPNLLLQNPAGR